MGSGFVVAGAALVNLLRNGGRGAVLGPTNITFIQISL